MDQTRRRDRAPWECFSPIYFTSSSFVILRHFRQSGAFVILYIAVWDRATNWSRSLNPTGIAYTYVMSFKFIIINKRVHRKLLIVNCWVLVYSCIYFPSEMCCMMTPSPWSSMPIALVGTVLYNFPNTCFIYSWHIRPVASDKYSHYPICRL